MVGSIYCLHISFDSTYWSKYCDKKYIPAVITGIICLPLSIWFIIVSINILSYSASQVIFYSLIGIIAIAGNLKIAHWIIHIFTKKLVAMEV